MRLIDAGALMAEMHNIILEDGEDRRIFYEVIERQPTIDPVKHGQWIVSDGCVCCSECGEPNMEWNYCPNCGADMRGEEDERFDPQTGGD